jgi:hypothetical protein
MENIKNIIINSKYKNNLDIIINIIHFLNNNLKDTNLIKIENLIIHEYYNNIDFTNFLCNLVHINNNINYFFEEDINNVNNIIFNKDLLEELENNGLLIFKNVLNKDNITKLLNELNNKKMHRFINGEIIYKNINLFENNNNIWWYNDPNEIYKFDFIQQLITNSYLLELIQKYLKTTPIFYSSNFWISYPGEIENTQQFHQDFDDIKFLKIFIYLNDVNKNNGPHFYIKNSLNKIIYNNNLPSNYKPSDRINDNFFDKYKENIMEINGDEGNLILEDTNGFHKGSNVSTGKRFILQFLFGVSNIFKLNYQNYEKIKLNKYNSSILYNAKEKYPFIFQNFIFE